MIAAVVILILKWNKAVYRKGSVPDGIGGGALYRAVYLNPGMILMYLYCIWETLQYILSRTASAAEARADGTVFCTVHS